MRLRYPILVALAAATLLPTGARAQERVRITGQVVDEQTGEPIPGVDLTVRTRGDRFLARATTDESGKFNVLVYRQKAVRIFASRIGYRDNSTPVLHFDGHDYFEVELRLDSEAVLLAPLEVVARAGGTSPVLEGFRDRLERGTGTYLTRVDIQRRNPMYVTDILQDVAGVMVSSSGSGTRKVVRMARSAGRNCPVQIFVDGLLVTRPVSGLSAASAGRARELDTFTIDDVVSPGVVEGIEVYRGLSSVPPEFLTPNAECGVIAIWTRRGG